MSPQDNNRIITQHLILCEGRDAKVFLIKLLDVCIKQNNVFDKFQILDFGGISQLKNYLLTISKMQGYEDVCSITIIRDAETNAESAVQSIKSSLAAAQLSVPDKPCCVSGGNCVPKTGYLLFPACSDNLEDGTLEDLCIQILKEPEPEDVLSDINNFLSLLKEQRNRKLPRLHKSQLHTYFSVTDDYVSLKIGEAAWAGAFNLNSELLAPLKEFLLKML